MRDFLIIPSATNTPAIRMPIIKIVTATSMREKAFIFSVLLSIFYFELIFLTKRLPDLEMRTPQLSRLSFIFAHNFQDALKNRL